MAEYSAIYLKHSTKQGNRLVYKCAVISQHSSDFILNLLDIYLTEITETWTASAEVVTVLTGSMGYCLF